ncbi:MAG: ATP phosphoribosyltransferase regulatory subunit [Gammaproteobacteria bacterium]|nr:ATP phosphoribosyltransferase regulatory subunit [Gammaproteobacteria bacterium]MBL6819500.1 ATP phosphoribosyltransferase regulatory subunit [Gammaproteobacteria bacterium]MBL6898869.1 ATP phosphoribosyltransferase regulatory subunit [Gammaproteobacteria bacterium]
MNIQKFLIPDGIDYYTGKDAVLFEKLKLAVINIFKKYKYEFVVTPIVDSINNLNNLSKDNLKNLTVSLSDRRELGIRSDITPQISKLDYQSYNKNKSNKFSYMGDIYRETESPFDRNNPFQVGAEYFGTITDSVDMVMIKMCHEIAMLSKTKKMLIELNDAYFITKFFSTLNLSDIDKDKLSSLISVKSIDEVTDFFNSKKLSTKKLNELIDLLKLSGNLSVINAIKQFSKKYNYNAESNIKNLKKIIENISSFKNTEIIIDICSLSSMDYETSFNYTFYIDSLRRPFAFGGRYESYRLNDGKMRHATGFSLDLKDVVTLYEK